jgi:hypothetical protein
MTVAGWAGVANLLKNSAAAARASGLFAGTDREILWAILSSIAWRVIASTFLRPVFRGVNKKTRWGKK